ncbi:MAG: hypothetical protein J0I06_20580, partial [Planctomycetes bacterium]|nr:hypothetical protein [Planctomycetota bacterium]
MGILTLRASQRRSLERQLRSTRDARAYRRTRAILCIGRGEPVADIARRLRGTRRVVYHRVRTYARHRPLRSAWSLEGHPKEVRLTGRNGRRVVFGATNLRTGHRVFLARARQPAGDSRALLRSVRSAYRGWRVVRLPDEDPSHTANGSVPLAERFGIELLWLPKRVPKL